MRACSDFSFPLLPGTAGAMHKLSGGGLGKPGKLAGLPDF